MSVALAPPFYNYITHEIVNPEDHPASNTVFEKGLEIKYFDSRVFNNVKTMF